MVWLPVASNSQYLRNCSARQIYACSTEAETNQKAVQHCEKMPRSSVGLDPNRYSNRYPFGPLAVHPLMQRVSGQPKLQVGASNRSFLSLKTKGTNWTEAISLRSVIRRVWVNLKLLGSIFPKEKTGGLETGEEVQCTHAKQLKTRSVRERPPEGIVTKIEEDTCDYVKQGAEEIIHQ